ncbi:MAG TPA: EI24 domain-containing protein [Actinomycetes bacterium]|nr:EI24 domain-containing protein [Actinomycetes bacterium]
MAALPPARAGRGAPPGAVSGAGYMARGMRTFLATPAVWLLGLVPVLIAGLLVLALLALLVGNVDAVAAWLTPFADHWSPGARGALRDAVGIAVVLGALLLAVLSFATLANMIGQPFFERISDRVERDLGDPPAGIDSPWWRTLPRATVESLVLFVLILGVNLPLLLLGLTPVVGQSLVPVVQAVVSGYLLSVELLAIPLERRGLRLRARLRFAWSHRGPVTGFGVAAFLLFLVPFANVVAMPGAVIGGTLLVRRLTGARDR